MLLREVLPVKHLTERHPPKKSNLLSVLDVIFTVMTAIEFINGALYALEEFISAPAVALVQVTVIVTLRTCGSDMDAVAATVPSSTCC